MGLKDGLSSLEVNATTISGTTISTSGATFGNSTIQQSELADGAVSGAKVADFGIAYTKIAQNFIVVGSPNSASTASAGSVTSGLKIVAGFSPAGSGDNGWIIFPDTFTGDCLSLVVTKAAISGVGNEYYNPAPHPGSLSAGSAWLRVSGAQVGSVYFIGIGPG